MASQTLKKIKYDNKEVQVESAIRDGDGNVIKDTYLKSADIPTKVSDLTNDSGFTSNAGTVTSVRVQAGTGLESSTSTAQSTSLNTTISIASGYKLPTTSEWDGKQSALSAQTEYVQKGSATKVPKITTNNLGQVTAIEEVTITQPTVNNGTLTIKAAGTSKGTFTANQSGNTEINITASDLGLSAAMKFLGTSSTSITDGATTSPITISGNSVTPAAGNVVLYGAKEFVWTGSAWEELGNEGSYALSSVTVTGTGALGGGGAISGNQTITHNEVLGTAETTAKVFKTKIDKYGHISEATAATASDVGALPDTTTYIASASKSGNTLTITPSSGSAISYTPSLTDHNQTVKVGSTTFGADDGIEIVAGTNITSVTADTTAKTITINAKDTTYSNATTSAAGLMSADDKTKLNGIAAGATANTGTVTGIKVGTGDTLSPSSGVVTIPAYPTTLPASDVSAWAKASTKPSYTASEVGAATSGHTHTLSLATDSGTSAVDLAANTKYKLTAGGSTLIFKTPEGGGSSSVATQSANGLMSSTDKTKLDGIATGATANIGTVTSVSVGSTSYSPTNGVVSLPSYPSVPVTSVNGATGTISIGDTTGIKFLTTAPTANNTDGGLKIVILTEEPLTKYQGYIYIIATLAA